MTVTMPTPVALRASAAVEVATSRACDGERRLARLAISRPVVVQREPGPLTVATLTAPALKLRAPRPLVSVAPPPTVSVPLPEYPT